MSNAILYVPGLKGDKSFSTGFQSPCGGYEEAIRNRAEFLRYTFRSAAYQTPENPFPLLSEMGQTAQCALNNLASHDHVVAIASSVGASVLMQAMFNNATQGKRNPDAAVFIGPVFDAIGTVTRKTPKEAFDSLEEDEITHIPVPVSFAKGQQDPGNFHFTLKHLQDPEALRLLALRMMPVHRAGLNRLVGMQIKIFSPLSDEFAPLTEAQKVMQMLDLPPKAQRLWDGGHNSRSNERINEVLAHLMKIIPQSTTNVLTCGIG